MPVPHLLKPPQDDATNIHSRTSLTLPFDTAVKAGTGYIRIYYGDGTLFKSISVTDSEQLTFSSDRKTVTISPKAIFGAPPDGTAYSSDYAAPRSYYVRVDAGAFVDNANPSNKFAGVADKTTFNFSTDRVHVNYLAADSTSKGGQTKAEIIANIALKNVGQLWGDLDCTDFVWAVTNLAGVRFFDNTDHTLNGSAYAVTDKGTGESVPHRWSPDATGDSWETVKLPPQQFSTNISKTQLNDLLQVGDVVRAYKSTSEAEGHSFIVAGRTVNTDGTVSVQIIDNVDGIKGNHSANTIQSHDLYAYGVADYLTLTSEIFISRLIGDWKIEGTKLDNILVGGKGNDSINGGAGKDTLIGGGGADKFYELAGSLTGSPTKSNFDKIVDFVATGSSATSDVLLLSNVALLTALPGWTVSNGIATKSGATLQTFIAAMANKNKVAAFSDGANLWVYDSVSTTSTANDVLVELVGVHNLTALSKTVYSSTTLHIA